MFVDPMELTKWAALIVGVTFVLCGVLLIGFRRGRLRGYNIYVVFSVALLALRYYAELETGDFSGWWRVAVWVNLAMTGVWGLVGMLRLAGTDPPVYTRLHTADEDRVSGNDGNQRGAVLIQDAHDDEVPVHDAQVLAKLEVMGGEITATGVIVDAIAEKEHP